MCLHGCQQRRVLSACIRASCSGVVCALIDVDCEPCRLAPLMYTDGQAAVPGISYDLCVPAHMWHLAGIALLMSREDMRAFKLP